MKRLNIYCGKTLAGVLIQHAANDYEFAYDADYQKSGAAPLSPTLPLTGEAYRSDHLFPFFFNLLPEGANKRTVCRTLRIDENDYFSLLAAFAGKDFIGNVSVEIAS